jgi:hypothetical protein
MAFSFTTYNSGYCPQKLQKFHSPENLWRTMFLPLTLICLLQRQQCCPILHFCSKSLRWHTPHCNLIRTKPEKTRIKLNLSEKRKMRRKQRSKMRFFPSHTSIPQICRSWPEVCRTFLALSHLLAVRLPHLGVSVAPQSSPAQPSRLLSAVRTNFEWRKPCGATIVNTRLSRYKSWKHQRS